MPPGGRGRGVVAPHHDGQARQARAAGEPPGERLMDLALTPEQRELQATLRRALSEQLPPSRLRAAIAGDEDVWPLTAEQLGVHGLAVPEALGGSGAGEVEQ